MALLKGVILDIDGTLINSNDAHAQAWQEALQGNGVRVSLDDIRPLIGMGGDRLIPMLAGVEEETSEGKTISHAHEFIFKEHFLPRIEVFPKTRELIRRMRDEGLEIAVATSANRTELKALLKKIGIEDLVQERTSSDDAKMSKPAPDIVQAALERLGHRPEEVLMLGDTPYDIEAARRAGIRTIAVRSGGWSDEKLSGAVAIYDDPEDLLNQFETSPLERPADPRRHVG